MFPTPTDQLKAARRQIELARESDPASAEALELLDGAAKLLRRLELQWDRRLPFLLDDNARAGCLLDELRPFLPNLAVEIEAEAARPSPQSEDQAHRVNLAWQRLLARAVNELPTTGVGDSGRARIAAHTIERIAANPALHRDPSGRPPLSNESSGNSTPARKTV